MMMRVCPMLAVLAGLIAMPMTCVAADPELKIVIQREKTVDGLVHGTIAVNGKLLGNVYENDAKKISTGTFPGVVRKTSMRNHAQSHQGVMGNSGDFLLEIAKVPGRTDILLHAGTKPEHSLGCVLCGPVSKDAAGNRIAPDVLKQLRLIYFDGNDTPKEDPKKTITVEVRDPVEKQ